MATSPRSRTTAAKKPADRQQPKGPDKPFRFTVEGKSHTIPPVAGVLTAGFVRKNRHTTALEQFFTLLEEVLPEDSAAMQALDSLPSKNLEPIFLSFMEHIGIDLGELEASASS